MVIGEVDFFGDKESRMRMLDIFWFDGKGLFCGITMLCGEDILGDGAGQTNKSLLF
jgi:hypothetical protein